MPDIGLLQGGPRPRIPAPSQLPDDTPPTQARVSAAPFLAPVDVAISVAAMSVPAVPVPAIPMPAIVSAPAAATAMHAGEAAPREAPASVPAVPQMNPR